MTRDGGWTELELSGGRRRGPGIRGEGAMAPSYEVVPVRLAHTTSLKQVECSLAAGW